LESVWFEYSQEFKGKPSIIKLNKAYGSKWRNKPVDRKRYSRRLKVYNAIIQVAALKRISEVEAAKLLDVIRGQRNCSVAKFQDSVLKDELSVAGLFD
jgi:hypothetical protein